MQLEKQEVGMVDRVQAICRDKDGKIKWQLDSKGNPDSKSMAETGMALVAALILTDQGGTAFDYVGIGTGTTDPTASDTDLETPVKRKAGTGTVITTTFTNDTSKLVATFSSADSLSGTDAITEYGMFNAASAGVMLFRKEETAKSVNWDDGDTLEVTLTVQMKQGA